MSNAVGVMDIRTISQKNPNNDPSEGHDDALLDALCLANWRAHIWEMRYNQLNRTHAQERHNVNERLIRIERLLADI
jgi:hypothetical protein